MRKGHVHLERRQSDSGTARVSSTTARTSGVLDDETWLEPVIDDHTSDPPLNPTRGDRYVIPCGASGEWAGRATQIAEWDGSKWVFTSPPPGSTVWVQSRTYFISLLDLQGVSNTPLTPLSYPARFWFPHHFLDNAHTINPITVVETTDTPPVSPGAPYTAYLVGDTPSGDWVGFDNNIAFTVCTASDSRTWVFYQPKEGQLVWDQDQSTYLIFNYNNTWEYFSEYVAGEIELGDLADVSDTPASDGDVLTWDDTDQQWEPRSPVHTLGGSHHSNVNSSVDSPSNGQFLKTNGTSWFNARVNTGDVDNDSTVISGSGSTSDALNDLNTRVGSLESSGGGVTPAEPLKMIRGEVGRNGWVYPSQTGPGWTVSAVGTPGNWAVGTWDVSFSGTLGITSNVSVLITTAVGGPYNPAAPLTSFAITVPLTTSGFRIVTYRWTGSATEWLQEDISFAFLVMWS